MEKLATLLIATCAKMVVGLMFFGRLPGRRKSGHFLVLLTTLANEDGPRKKFKTSINRLSSAFRSGPANFALRKKGTGHYSNGIRNRCGSTILNHSRSWK